MSAVGERVTEAKAYLGTSIIVYHSTLLHTLSSYSASLECWMDSNTKGVVWPKLTLQLGHNKIASWKMLLKIFFFLLY